MDNLGAHICPASKDEMKKLKFRWILNVRYSPQWNPIELVFSQFKASFKAARARKLMGLTNVSHEELVRQSWTNLKKKNIVACIRHVNDLLK